MSLNMVWKYGWNAQNWIISVANERYKNGISDYVIIFLINLFNLPRHRLQKGKNHRFWHSIAGNHKYHNLWSLCLAMPLKRIISTLTNNLIIHKWIYNLYKFIHEYSDRNIHVNIHLLHILPQIEIYGDFPRRRVKIGIVAPLEPLWRSIR